MKGRIEKKKTVIKLSRVRLLWVLRTPVSPLNSILIALGREWRSLCREMTGGVIYIFKKCSLCREWMVGEWKWEPASVAVSVVQDREQVAWTDWGGGSSCGEQSDWRHKPQEDKTCWWFGCRC